MVLSFEWQKLVNTFLAVTTLYFMVSLWCGCSTCLTLSCSTYMQYLSYIFIGMFIKVQLFWVFVQIKCIINQKFPRKMFRRKNFQLLLILDKNTFGQENIGKFFLPKVFVVNVINFYSWFIVQIRKVIPVLTRW